MLKLDRSGTIRVYGSIAMLLVLGAGSAAGSAWALEISKSAEISRVDVAPKIDGQLEPGEWAKASIISDLHQVMPVEFSDPSEETTWYLMYDDNALYVAVIAYDAEPDRITAQTLRQGGNLFSDDTVSVLVDAFNNKRSGYSFSVNPFGIREDAIYTSGTSLSDDWDGIWRSGAQITAEGWTAEMAIPFNTLTFDPANDTWGFNLSRDIKRKNEQIAWNSRNGSTNPTVSGELRGFRDLDQGKGLDVIPSVSATSWNQHIEDYSESELRPSLDINYKLTPAISLLVTLNTDFAATEVDGRQLNVSRFSLFFPEKRSFFLTDFDIFQFGGISGGGFGGGFGGIPGMSSGTNGLAFYSRRIGLSPTGEAVDLTGGLKLSGRAGDIDFGTLYVRQEGFADAEAGLVVDASDLFVARATKGVLAESSIGLIATAGDPQSDASSSLVGMDFNYRNTRLPNNRTLESWAWVQKSNNEGLDGDDMAWSIAIGLPSQEGWEFGGQVHEAQKNYDPRLGFVYRRGVRMYSGAIGYQWINDESQWFQRSGTRLDFHRWEYLDTGLLQSQELDATLLDMQTAGGDNLGVGISIEKERLLEGENPLGILGISIEPGEYEFRRWNMHLHSANHRPVKISLRLDGGEFYDGDRYGIGPGTIWQVNHHVSFQLDYNYTKYDFADVTASTRQATFQNEIAFNSSWSLVTLAQWDNLSSDLGTNLRLHYNRAAGQDFWLVLNHNMREFDPDEPNYPGAGRRSVDTLVAAKFRYTFRF